MHAVLATRLRTVPPRCASDTAPNWCVAPLFSINARALCQTNAPAQQRGIGLRSNQARNRGKAIERASSARARINEPVRQARCPCSDLQDDDGCSGCLASEGGGADVPRPPSQLEQFKSGVRKGFSRLTIPEGLRALGCMPGTPTSPANLQQSLAGDEGINFISHIEPWRTNK